MCLVESFAVYLAGAQRIALQPSFDISDWRLSDVKYQELFPDGSPQWTWTKYEGRVIVSRGMVIIMSVVPDSRYDFQLTLRNNNDGRIAEHQVKCIETMSQLEWQEYYDDAYTVGYFTGEYFQQLVMTEQRQEPRPSSQELTELRLLRRENHQLK